MASNNQAPAFLVVALILFAAANPLSHAQLLPNLGGVVSSILSPVLNGVGTTVSGLGGAVNGVGTTVSGLGGAVSGLGGAVSGVVPGVVTPVVSGVVTPVVSSVGGLVPRVVSPVLSGAGGLVSGVGGAVSSVGGVVSGLGSTVAGVGGLVPTVVSPVVSGVGGVVSGVVVPVVSGVGGLVPGVVSPVASAAGGLLSGLQLNGLLCCTANGNCPAGAAGIAGVPVSLVCTNILGVNVPVGQNTTGVNGIINISVPSLLSTVGGLLNSSSPLPCAVNVQLPLNQTLCPILSTAGNIVGGTLTAVQPIVQNVVSTVNGLVGIVTGLNFAANATVRA